MQYIIRLIALVCLLATSSVYARPYKSIEEFLQMQPLIRVCVSRGPGYGDQANAANVITHLRELGYHGNFEVVYSRDVLNAVTTVFNLPATIPDVYEDQTNHTRFIEVDTYEKLLAASAIANVEFGFNMGKTMHTCDNENANAETFASFLPYFNHEGQDSDATHINVRGNPDEITQYDSGKKYLLSHVTTYAEAKTFLQNTPLGKQTVAQKPALNTLLEGMDNNKFNIMFVYGYTLKMNGDGNFHDVNAMAGNIFEMIAGARYAQLYGSAQLKKPIVIAVFYDYKNDMDTVMQLLQQDDWGQSELPGAKEVRTAAKALQLKKVLHIADISNPATIDIINSLEPNHILILSMGAFPKTAFDGLYNYTAPNVLPAVREGAGSFNSLVTTGRPSFECANNAWQDSDAPATLTWTAGLDLIQDPALKQRMTQLYDSHSGFCGMDNYYVKDAGLNFTYRAPWLAKIHTALGQFMIDAIDPNSAFSQYFVALQKNTQKPENDRVRFALEEVVTQLNKKV